MNKHQELRDAIRNLMKANDAEIKRIELTEDFSETVLALWNQNTDLQAILDAHKQPLSDERKNNEY